VPVSPGVDGKINDTIKYRVDFERIKSDDDVDNIFNEFNESGKTKIMESIIGKALTNSYHKRLAYLEGKKIVSLVDYAKNDVDSIGISMLYNF
jgi:hypothetical protein